MAVIAGAGGASRNDSASGAQVIDGSLRFESNNKTYLSRTFLAGNQKIWTWSGWVKRNLLDTRQFFLTPYSSNGNYTFYFCFDSSDTNNIQIGDYPTGWTYELITSAKYRDIDGWYHVLLAFDTTQDTANDRVKLYVNGDLQTFGSGSQPSQNSEAYMNQAGQHDIGLLAVAPAYSDWSMSQVNFLDGQALGPSYFGFTDPLTGIWRPKKFTGDYNISKAVNDSGLPYSAATRLMSYEEEGTVNDNATGYTLPMSNPAHYGGKARDLASGGFKVTTVNSAAEDFFMGMWVKFDTYTTSNLMGVALTGSYVYFETRSSGVIGIRHDGGSRSDSSATDIDDGNWHHIALSRTGGTLYGLLDGTAIVNTTSGVSGNSVGENETFFFWGGHSSYNIDGQVIDPFVYIGQGASSYTTPTAPLVDSSGTINYLSGFSSSEAYYISPGVTITGSSPNTANYPNSFYLPMDGNTSVAKDHSGNDNDWTLHHTGSAPLNKATGAFPILNTISGGTIASPKVRGQVGVAVTVYNPTGAQNRYYFDGIEAPSYNFSRGQNVTFDLSDSTVATHQLKFSTTSDGTHGGGSAYDDGAAYGAISAGTVGAATTITFPHNAQNTLYYYCVNHSGMGGSVGLNTDVSIADPYAWKNILAAPLNRSPTDYSNLVNCTATARTLTVDGPTIGSNNNFYNRSYYWDGSDDKITAPNSADFNLKSAGWTAECWARPQDDSDQVDLITYLTTTTGWYMFIDSNMKFGCGWQVSGGSYQEILSPANAVVWDKWQHFAAVCDSGTVKLYLNGILQPDTEATSGDSQDPGGGTLGIGWKGGSYPDWLKGNIQDVRIYHVCKYTENFIPAATNPDILPASPSGVAYSSELTQATDGAVTFGQEGGYMTVPEDADWDFGTGDYTAEAWVYMTGTDNYVFATLISGSWWGLNFWTNNSSWSIRAGYNSKHEYTGIEWNYRQWYHVAVARESGTSRLFLDGKLIDSQADTDNLDSTGALQVGRDANSWNKQFGGLISNARIVKGTAVYTLPFTPSSTPLTNITNTKLLCCQSKTSATAYAVSPGSITAEGQATASPFNPFDDDIDMVLGKSSNYCTLNPLNIMGNITLSDGNLHGLFAGSGSNRTGGGNVGVSTGSWYYEATLRVAGGSHPFCGFVTSTSIAPGSTSNLSAAAFDGSVWCGNGGLSTGDVVGNVLDLSGTAGMGVTYYALINGVEIFSSSSYVSGTSADLSLGLTWIPALSGVTSTEWELNFGQKPFKFLPPEGFGPLCTATNELPQIARPSNVVGVSTWLGTGADNHTINTGFQADLLWIKDRDTSSNWYCFDSVRGRTQVFHPNLTNDESGPETNIIRNLSNKSGYILGQAGDGNNSSYNYVGYSWKAGGNAGTFNKDGVDAGSAAAAGVSGGSITPTACSVGTREGFSILKYEGTGNASDTIATGLDIPVDFYIVKSTDNVGNWNVASKAMGLQYSLVLNANADRGSASADYWNSTDPTNTLISIGTADSVNADGWNFIVYAWANRPGLQKFGSYTGNGSATDGVYVELGFRPALLITKKSSSTSNWIVWDKERSPYNVCNAYLYMNDTDTEDTDGANGVDFLSNGFKMYNNYTDANNDGADYIYMAWAESSFNSLYGAQSNAR